MLEDYKQKKENIKTVVEKMMTELDERYIVSHCFGLSSGINCMYFAVFLSGITFNFNFFSTLDI